MRLQALTTADIAWPHRYSLDVIVAASHRAISNPDYT